MNFEVVTANRQAQSLADTATAIFVISNEDIKQSGVTTIADALRMAPGVQVAKSGSHAWAVSIRGFNDRFSNKLLVLMDGRTLYNPLHSGVTWEAQDMILEDIDRIEVIRGPGAAMWGANAVNRVINIITRDSANTTGTLVTAAAGNAERLSGQLRHGGTIGEGGFRMDHIPSPQTRLTLQGDAYKSRLNDTDTTSSLPLPIGTATQNIWDMKGYHLLGKWQHNISEKNHLQAILYYDSTALTSPYGEEDRDTLDFDFQQVFPLASQQSITWGLSLRQSSDTIGGSYQLGPLHETNRRDQIFSAFLQDEFSIFHPSLTFTLGSKFEHNDYTGYEIQPSIRGTWRPADNYSLWTAISRAVRTPSYFEHDGPCPHAAISGSYLLVT